MPNTNRMFFWLAMGSFVLCNLHITRNIVYIFPIVTVIFYIMTLSFLMLRNSFAKFPFVVIMSLLAIMIYSSIISFSEAPIAVLLEASGRFFFTIPFLFIGAGISKSQLRKFFIISSFFGALGGLSLLFQFLFGPIDWFAEPSMRNGLPRYASMLGSLTIMGTFAGIVFPLAFFTQYNTKLKYLFLTFIFVGCVLSLQKAAVMNMILFLSVVLYSKIIRRAYFQLTAFLCLGIFAAWVFNLSFGRYFASIVENFFRFNESASLDDFNPIEGMVMRLWQLPSILFEQYGWNGLLFGVGLKGGAGSLGFPDSPMAHNYIFDMLFIGGVPYLSLHLYLLIRTTIKTKRLAIYGDDVDVASFVSILIFFANLIASTGMQFQPVTSSIIYLIVGYHFLSARIQLNKVGQLHIN